MCDAVKWVCVASLLNVFGAGLTHVPCEIRQTLQRSSLLMSGETVVFFGDSITERGGNPGGYVLMIRDFLNQGHQDSSVRILHAGKSGNKVEDLSARLDRDVLPLQPDWVVISIGINDVWHRLSSQHHQNVLLPRFASELEDIVRRLQERGIKPILCTTTIIDEDVHSPGNVLLQSYNNTIASMARARRCLLADVNRKFMDTLRRQDGGQRFFGQNTLTRDGVHLNSRGNWLLAQAILASWGFEAEDWEPAKLFNLSMFETAS
jgi:lysophospholipase L1-like esterase